MKRYFLVEIDNDDRAKVAGIQNVLAARYRATSVLEMKELHFEARDGSRIHSDREMLEMEHQTVSGWIDRK